ncbi:AIR synthase related protein [Citricoccus sp.]|uniref:thiamine-phosphate kinase n=1 Tax=Citricoccus sp. TaxID=1978372 RepID=UPI002CC212D1|nr:AIR synthase related protein [Citricoccus sp.]HRO95124.1 AIR synthase related protein [Citricoccus sp.]
MSTGQQARSRGSTGDRTVGGLGEAGILRILNRRFAVLPAAGDWPEGTVGPGDDAAVVSAPDGRFVISTDAMAQDRDFRLDWPAVSCGASRGGGGDDVRGFAGGYSIGWKAAAQNLSDMNAMGADATGLLLALTMPHTTGVSWIDGLAAGIAGAVRRLGARRCRVVGGDLGSDDRITLAITATGDLGGRPAVRRAMTPTVSAADPVDLVLCGRAGWAAAGLAVLDTSREELLDRLRRGAPGVRRLAARAATAQLRPRPVLGAGRRAAEAGALAMMDVSDGVAKDAGRLALVNGRRVELDPDWVRSDAAVLDPLARALGQDARDWVTAGGEDYGLLAVLPARTRIPHGFRRVGRLLPGDLPGVTGDGGGAGPGAGPVEWPQEGSGMAQDQGGWDHFARDG